MRNVHFQKLCTNYFYMFSGSSHCSSILNLNKHTSGALGMLLQENGKQPGPIGFGILICSMSIVHVRELWFNWVLRQAAVGSKWLTFWPQAAFWEKLGNRSRVSVCVYVCVVKILACWFKNRVQFWIQAASSWDSPHFQNLMFRIKLIG